MNEFTMRNTILSLLVPCLLFGPFVTAAKSWESISTAGFGDANNTAATLIKVDGQLYAITDNTHGVQFYSYDNDSNTWAEETSVSKWGFLDDNANIAVSAKLQKSKQRTLVAFENNDSGAAVWRITKDGATRLNYDGFGNEAYQTVLHLLKYNGRVLAYVQNEGDGNVRVLKKPTNGSLSWEFMNDLASADYTGLDAAVVYDDAIYLANGDPARIYKSVDGINYSQLATFTSETGGEQVADFQVEGDVLFAAGTARRFCYDSQQALSSTRDGVEWILDETRPEAAFCYTQIVLKRHTSTAYFLGFDTEDAVLYKRHDETWTEQTANGLNGEGGTATNNRQFSDGIWYQGNIVVATENDNGTQIWTKR